MKNILRINPSILVLIILLCSCESDPDPTAPQQDDLTQARQDLLDQITATWEPTAVMRNGTNVISDFAEFELTVGNKTYRSKNGNQAWPVSGTWEFVEGKSDEILRDDDVVIHVVPSQNKVIVMGFSIEEEVFSEARTKTVEAEYEFEMEN